MPARWISSVQRHLARAANGTRWGRRMDVNSSLTDVRDADDQERSRRLVQYHLGRGRRARESGRFETGVDEARRALAVNSRNPWALALLAQCLTRRVTPDLNGARTALERARTFDPTNGYFVRLLLDVLDTQGDVKARADLLDVAWWSGAPVERWLPDGPTRPWADDVPAASRAFEQVRPDTSVPRWSSRISAASAPATAGRQPVHA